MKIGIQKLSYSLVFIMTLLLAGCADAGSDKEVQSSSIVVLEGNRSTACVGGEIKKYKWEQASGIHVEINNPENKITTFTAPSVATETVLIFKLITTEEGGYLNNFVTYDCVRVTVQPNSGGDTTPPVITLIGESNMTVYVNSDTYIETGATAVDDVDGNVDVNMTGTIDRDTAGIYILTYTARDSAGNTASVERMVNVIENNETNITVESISDGSEGEGELILHEVNLSGVTNAPTVFDYKIESLTAFEDEDFNPVPLFTNPDIIFDSNNSTIIVPEGISSFEIGIESFADEIIELTETYSISVDNVNATGTIVNPDGPIHPPVITLNGDSNITLLVGEPYIELGATAIDVVDGDINITITGEVNTTIVGVYTLIYTAVDAAGNSATVERIVTVIENSDSNKTAVDFISGNVSKEEGTAVYNVTLEGPTMEDTIYHVEIFNKKTEETTFQDVSVPAGQVTFSINVVVLFDSLDPSGDEPFIITIDGVNNDPIVILPTFSISNTEVMEEDHNLSFIITLSDVSSSDTVISVNTTDGTAIGGEDYVVVSRDVIIPAGTTTAIVTVSVINDTITETIETMTLNGVSSDTNNISASGTGTIISSDDDDSLKSFSISDTNATEGENNLTFIIALSGISPSDTVISLNTTDGTAISGEDYVAVSQDVVIPAGTTTAIVTVSVIDDAITEDIETMILTGTSSDTFNSNATGTGKIIDTNNTHSENNNSVVFENGQYGNINLTSDWTIPEGALFLDIRTDEERVDFRPVGAVGGAIYEYRNQNGSQLNPNFVDNVLTLVENNKQKQIILICHSGSRTTEAAELLSNEGFSNVWQIVGGMNSWEELKSNEILSGAL